MRQLLLADAIEVKRDDGCLKYQNKPGGPTLFVEVAHKDGSPSGVMVSDSDTWAFHIGAHDTDDGEVTGGVVVFVQTDKLKEYVLEAIESHSPNVKTWPNVGVLVPWGDILKLA